MQRRRPVIVGLISALALLVAIPTSANSAPSRDLTEEREAVRAEQSRVAGRIDVAEASVAEIDAALTTIQENLTTQRAALEKAVADLEQAERDVADAEAAIGELGEEIEVLREEMARRAIQAYVNPPSDELLSSLGSSDFTSATEQQFYVDLRSQDDADLEDALNGLQIDLEDQRAKAIDATERADAARTAQADKVAEVEAARADQDRVLADANAHLNAQIALSLELAGTDAELSAEIAAEQAELAARLARFQAEKERQDAEIEAAGPSPSRPTSPSKPTTPSGPGTSVPPPTTGGGSSNPPPTTAPPVTAPPTTAPPTTSPPTTTPPPTGGLSICSASGFQVNCAIVGSVNAMIGAARADGIVLGGSAYRSSQSQINLRIANGCGGSRIYDPTCKGSPPTAVPGRSQHELGLALDLAYQGRTICYPYATCAPGTNRAYDWLMANAGRFGFYKLSSEAWHWSTTGR